jgi:hypothetical protein
VFCEGNLRFDFTDCGVTERFDEVKKNADGLKAVDFIAETDECLYFIEVKDYQHPNAPQKRKDDDRNMLINAMSEDKSIFALEMGAKIKDSLLRKYAEGYVFAKKVKYLLFINLDQLGANEHGQLREKISGYIPIGLKNERFHAFSEISFDVVNANQLEQQYKIKCTSK